MVNYLAEHTTKIMDIVKGEVDLSDTETTMCLVGRMTEEKLNKNREKIKQCGGEIYECNNIEVDWNSVNIQVLLTAKLYEIVVYADIGEELVIKGDCTSMFSNLHDIDTLDLRAIKIKPNYCNLMFSKSSMKHILFKNIDTKYCIDMMGMFSNCRNLEKIDLSKFDTSKVESFREMFIYCEKLTELDLSNFVININASVSYMLSDCISLHKVNLSNFEVYSGPIISNAFYRCNSLEELSIKSFFSDEKYAFSILKKCPKLTLDNFKVHEINEIENYLTDELKEKYSKQREIKIDTII